MIINHIRPYENDTTSGVRGEIVYANGHTQTLFFEVGKDHGDCMAPDASAFLSALLPVAMRTGEDITVEGTVSAAFFKKIQKIQTIVHGWNKGLSPVSVRVESDRPDKRKGKKTGCFFSGGADSYYTYIQNRKTVDSLIFVHGFDIKLKDATLYAMVEKNMRHIAEKQKVQLVQVRTNIREIYDPYVDWDLAHGFAVGSVALFLRDGFRSIYVSCGLPASYTDHHSMTPDLDPLWSGEHMKVIHYGCHAEKLEKLKTLSKYPLVMNTLRVCWVNKKDAYNCCVCEKCARNMVGLYICDVLETCTTFDKPIDVRRLSKTRVGPYELKYYRALLRALDAKGDTSAIRAAIHTVILGNTSLKQAESIGERVRHALQTLDKKYNKNRLYWFLAHKGWV